MLYVSDETIDIVVGQDSMNEKNKEIFKQIFSKASPKIPQWVVNVTTSYADVIEKEKGNKRKKYTQFLEKLNYWLKDTENWNGERDTTSKNFLFALYKLEQIINVPDKIPGSSDQITEMTGKMIDNSSSLKETHKSSEDKKGYTKAYKAQNEYFRRIAKFDELKQPSAVKLKKINEFLNDSSKYDRFVARIR